MKTFPETWGTRHVAYFAGVLSMQFMQAGHSIDQLVEHVNASISANEDGFLLFTDLVERLEPFILRAQWNDCVKACDKLFSRQPEASHAK